MDVAELPAKLFQQRGLLVASAEQELDLSRNRLAALPDSLAPVFRSLKKLRLARNALPAVSPQLLSSLQRLEHLDLSFNRLTVFPFSDGKLSELQSLDIRGNPITKLPCFLATARPSQIFFDWALVGFVEERVKTDIEGFSFKADLLQRSLFLLDVSKLAGAGSRR